MTFNHAEFIAQAIDSVLAQQTNFDFEIVIGDDFSTDETPQILERYQKAHPEKIRVLNRPIGGEYALKRKELGRLYNFTNIIDNCRGSYVALLDGDDFWTDPHKLQKQIDFLEAKPEVNLCLHNLVVKYEYDKETNKDHLLKNISESFVFDLAYLVENPMFCFTASACIRKSALRLPEWFVKVFGGEITCFALAVNYGKGYFMPEPMGVYRRNEKSIMHAEGNLGNTIKMFQERIFINEQLAKHLGSKFSKMFFNKNKALCYQCFGNNKKITRKLILFASKNYRYIFSITLDSIKIRLARFANRNITQSQ